jgi:hypothetical protein
MNNSKIILTLEKLHYFKLLSIKNKGINLTFMKTDLRVSKIDEV